MRVLLTNNTKFDMENKIDNTKKPQHDAKHLLADSASLTEAQIEHQIEMDEEEGSYWMDDDDYEDEIIGYECLACGHIHNEKPMDGCDKCLSYSVDAMYG